MGFSRPQPGATLPGSKAVGRELIDLLGIFDRALADLEELDYLGGVLLCYPTPTSTVPKTIRNGGGVKVRWG